ncbi:hypothetical protein K435DRAFT_669157, partial [Dendrothele bispora CBS 962.96]
KFNSRIRVAVLMKQASQDAGDDASQDYWKYVYNVIGLLGHEGMSDEEDGAEANDEHAYEQVIHVKNVLTMAWRNPEIRELMQLVDATPGVEAAIFRQVGRAKLPRRRVDKVSTRATPKHIPPSFFDPTYLQSLPQIRQINLHMRKKDFPLRARL